MAEPIRVVVWGPGGLGSISIREISMLPEFKLVGVYAYSASKHGVDAGTLIGLPPMGVAVSNNADEVLAIDCDCLLFTARDMATFHNDDEIVRLLEAGKNIVTALPYQYMHITRPPEYVARVQAACEKGRSVFHATGVNPDLIGETLLQTLTGLCNDVKHVRMQENWDVSYIESATLQVCGYGQPVEVARQSPVVAAISSNFTKQGLMSWAETLGITYDRVTVDSEFTVAEADLHRDAPVVIPKGTVACITNRMSGYLKDAARPFMTVEVHWAFQGQYPAGVERVFGWIITIEGRPSLRTVVDIKSSFETGERLVVPGNTGTDAGYHAVVATLLKGVVNVRKAKPGILKPLGSPVHWLPDLRNL